jgi:hypothetical protein
LTTFAVLPPGAIGAALMLGLWINTAAAQQPPPPQQPQSQQQPPQQQPPLAPPPPLQPLPVPSQPQEDVVLVPHRATYDMKLADGRQATSGVADVTGRMVLETVDSCDGWEIKQRIKLSFVRNDGEEFETDSNFTSYESKDGLALRFSVRNTQNDEVEEELRGQADLESLGGKGRASFTLPEARSFDLPVGTMFPTTHLMQIIRHARAGEKAVTYTVFDGARLDGAFHVNAVIGKSPKPAVGAPPMRGDLGLMRNVPSWGVRFAFFAADDQGAQPEYELALDLLANGIARSMQIDYGDFAVDARLIQLQALQRPKC